MSDRPSDGMELDELRDEFDWMFEFQSRMAERIRGDADVHSLADYVGKLEAESIKLRELVRDMHKALFSLNLDHCQACPREDACVFMHKSFDCDECAFERDMRELGVEVD